MPQEAREIVRFWQETGPGGWYSAAPELDAEITRRYRTLWDEAASGGLRDWLTEAHGALAYLLVTDQFPRNMFRNDARAFSTDGLGRNAAIATIARGLDLRWPEPIRQFFYLPFMHSESTFDQDRCVCLMIARMPETGAENLRHARAHRDIIRQFGRFPYRNAVLGRTDTPEEAAFLRDGGYMSVVNALA